MAMVKTQIPEGYATIRRSKSRAKKFHDAPHQFEMIDMSSINQKSEILYNNHQNDIYDDAEVDDEGAETDVFMRKNADDKNISQMSYFGDNKQRTFETFKPRENHVSHSSATLTSNNDLRQSSDYLPYDFLMSPLKSPQYINQLNAMRNKTTTVSAAASKQQFPLYSRPESPLKFTKIMHNNRSNSPSADSIDNCSSNSSSTYSPAYRNGQQITTLLTSDENLMLIDNGFRRPLPKKTTNLSYRKSFSHVQNRAHYMNGENNNSSNYNYRKHNGNLMNNEANSQECINSGNYEKPSISTLTTMTTKPLSVVPSVSTSNLYTRHRFATLAHPKEKLRAAAFNTKSTHSLNESHVHFWDPVLDSKIGSQTTLRAKPAIPWWEIACKKEYRQSCPPLKVNIIIYLFPEIHNQLLLFQHLIF